MFLLLRSWINIRFNTMKYWEEHVFDITYH